MTAVYDTIGKDYSATRAADPRITRRLIELLDLPKGSTLLDIGAGTGNYSLALAEAGYSLAALEPSKVMREQGDQHHRLAWQEGSAESLPYATDSFDGVVMTLCMHHFSDWKMGLTEAIRVVGQGPIVILTFDAQADSGFWLFDYFPDFLQKDKAWFPRIEDIKTVCEESLAARLSVHPFPLPPDLADHFLSAGWARPEIYLNQNYRSGISSFASVDKDCVDTGLRRLEEDLASGAWDSEYGELRRRQYLDTGYVFLRIAKREREDSTLQAIGTLHSLPRGAPAV